MHEMDNSEEDDTVWYRQVWNTLVSFLGKHCDCQLKDRHETLRGHQCPVWGVEPWEFLALHLYVVDGGVGLGVGDLQRLSHPVPQSAPDPRLNIQLGNWTLRLKDRKHKNNDTNDYSLK